jgi:hypothetical protein
MTVDKFGCTHKSCRWVAMTLRYTSNGVGDWPEIISVLMTSKPERMYIGMVGGLHYSHTTEIKLKTIKLMQFFYKQHI